MLLYKNSIIVEFLKILVSMIVDERFLSETCVMMVFLIQVMMLLLMTVDVMVKHGVFILMRQTTALVSETVLLMGQRFVIRMLTALVLNENVLMINLFVILR